MNNRTIARLTMAAGLVSFGGLGWGQCLDGGWKAGPLTPSTGGVFGSVVWDQDGAGPLPSVLVMGGRFDRAGGPGFEGQLVGNLAGLMPSALGGGGVGGWMGFANGVEAVDGLFVSGGVYKTAVYNNELIATGWFQMPGESQSVNIAKWTGGHWETFGRLNARGCALLVRNGELIVGGGFTSAGGVPANGIAAWNGTAWRAFGSGLTGRDDTVWALASYGGELIAAGSFDDAGGTPVGGIARWNGSRWAAVGAGVPQYDEIYTLLPYGAELYAGGYFDQIGGVNTQGIGRWNGAVWQAVGEGLDGSVWAMMPYGGELVVAGSFWPVQHGREDVADILKWNGTRWANLTSGPNPWGTIYTLNTWEGKLVAGGNFGLIGTQRVDGVASWDGSAWAEIPGMVFDDTPSPNIKSMAVWNGKVIMGGAYHMTGGGTSFDNISSWNGASATSMPVYSDGAVLAMTPVVRGNFQPDQLVIGGAFTTLWFGSDPHNHVALLDPIADVNGRIARPMGAGLNDTVWALTRFGGQTIAGGDFTASGAAGINRFAKYDGASWVPFDGLGGFNGSVRVFKPYTVTFRNYLAVGGSFTSGQGIAANRIAQYSYNTLTGQTSWSGLDPGFNNRVDAIERFNGALYAGGNFTATSTGTPLLRVARYVSGAWEPVGAGFNGPVTSLFADGAYLYAGGRFTASGATPLNNFARWDGAAWAAVDAGVNATVNTIAKHQGEILVGGTFTRVGPGSEGGAGHGVIESPFMSRFSTAGAPWIAVQPESRTVCRAGGTTLSAIPATGYTVTHAWRKDGVPVAAGPTGRGSTITLSGPYLFISNTQPGDAGVYDCTISSPCGSATSSSATVRVCAADANCDGFLDFFDYTDFVEAFETGSPLRIADFNADGFVDFFDYDGFVEAFEEGC